jgi:hypothetical protein
MSAKVVFVKLFLNFSSEYITRHSETHSIPHQHVWIHKLSLRIQHLQHGFSLWRAAIWICFRYAKSCDALPRRGLSTSISGSITQCWRYLILAEWHVVTIGHSCHSSVITRRDRKPRLPTLSGRCPSTISWWVSSVEFPKLQTGKLWKGDSETTTQG